MSLRGVSNKDGTTNKRYKTTLAPLFSALKIQKIFQLERLIEEALFLVGISMKFLLYLLIIKRAPDLSLLRLIWG